MMGAAICAFTHADCSVMAESIANDIFPPFGRTFGGGS
jgi:hypothetical protein